MTKTEIAERLRGMGYKAANENGCVMIAVPEITPEVQKNITAILTALEYHGSYGWRKEQQE